MSHLRITRITAAAALAVLTMTACGLQEGAERPVITGGQAAAQPAAGTAGSTGSTTTGTTPVTGDTTDDGAGQEEGGATPVDSGASDAPVGETGGQVDSGTSDGGTTDGGTTDGGTTDSGSNEGSTGEGDNGTTSEQNSTQQVQVTGSDRTGVTADSITVAFHAPVTGAAPLPAESFREARDLYWLYQGAEGRKFLGRDSVEVLFTDDKYDPANARQVCRQLAAEAFIVAGGGGTDGIQACGQLAGVQGFPYFSAGVTEAGLTDNPWYFAASMTYRQQGVLLAHYIAKNFPGQTFGAIITDTPNFNDAQEGFEAGIAAAGIGADYAGTLRHPRNDTSWYSSFASDLDSKGVEVVYFLSAPVSYIEFAQQANQSGRGPFQYVGVGVSKGLNAVLPNGCPDIDGGIFFSPFPGLDWARQNEPTFFTAAEQFNKVPDDLALALWSINKQLDVMFQRYEEVYGTDLTREDFRNLVEGMGTISSGVFPDVSYSPTNHFGGSAVHVLQADCASGEHVTLEAFATGFDHAPGQSGSIHTLRRELHCG